MQIEDDGVCTLMIMPKLFGRFDEISPDCGNVYGFVDFGEISLESLISPNSSTFWGQVISIN